jgi:KaiC/GvpD/RAD55 family RecA-like ATPase
MDIGAVVLHKLLKEQDLEAWSRIRSAYFPNAFSSLILAINKYYNTYSEIPSFEQLSTITRESSIVRALSSLETLEVPDIELSIAIDALIDQYAQDQTIGYLDKFIEKLPILDVDEIKDELSGMVLRLDEQTMTSENVVCASDYNIFEKPEVSNLQRFPLGINNTFDSTLGGAYRQELILIGGKRGAGKSLVCSNIAVAQYEMGNSVIYFTIEMRAKEVIERNSAIQADVSHMSIRQQNLTEEDIRRLAKVRAAQFLDADDVYNDFMEHGDRYKFESAIRHKVIKPDNQIVIVDDRSLSLSTIDLHLQKAKAKFKDKLTVCIVDYLNQIVFPGNRDSMYDWKVQIEISKQLKNLARKYDITMISPMQIDEKEGIRYAQGILDSPDIAFILNAHTKEDKCITFETTKIRGGPPISFTSPMDWGTMRMSPQDIPAPTKQKKAEDGGEKKKGFKAESKNDDGSDTPW